MNCIRWVNRKDRFGRDVLGLDTIGIFDHSAEIPPGGCLEQSGGTAPMASAASTCLMSRQPSRPTTR
jgi:hypothetical protein